MLDRIQYALLDSAIPVSVGFTIADDGSPMAVSNRLIDVCKRNGFNYVRIESELSPVCMSRARNKAVVNIESDYVMFQDADLMPYDGFYASVVDEIAAQDLGSDAANFLMIGVIYLTDAATTEYVATDSRVRRSKFMQYLLEDNKDKIDKFSTGTSVTVFNRHYYLSRGGYDEDFVEWGYEDLEFNVRCIRALKKFPLPEKFLEDIGTFRSINHYSGWKSVYRLFGDITFSKGIVMFHSWHEIDAQSGYMKKKSVNADLFLKKVKAFASAGTEPNPLPMAEKGKTLCFSETNPFVYNRKTAPFFGQIYVVDELSVDSESIIGFIKENSIDRVVFHNPYANNHRLALFRSVRSAGIKFYIAERGALRDSVFFDDTGFNADSTRYSKCHWPAYLTEEQTEKVKKFIIQEKTEETSLEDQPARVGKNSLLKKLKIKSGQKVVFVPLQRPSDTVIKYFSDRIGGYDVFIDLVAKSAAELSPEYIFVAKKHPLEVGAPDIPGVVYANDVNVKDLLDLSEAVLLINSGVGVLSLMYQKNLLVAGEAFYDEDCLVHKVKSVEDVAIALGYGVKPSRADVLRFFYYLIFEFYSFGKFETKKIPWENDSYMTITTKIDFYQILIPGLSSVVYSPGRSLIPRTSILFDRYRTLDSKAVISAERKAVPPEKQLPKANVAKVAEDMSINGMHNNSFGKKFKKFRENPTKFYGDSNSTVVKFFGRMMGYGRTR